MCPPVGTSTNLNKDLINADNITLDKAARDELEQLAFELIEYNEAVKVFEELESLNEKNMWKNWYHGYTRVAFPNSFDDYFEIRIQTAAVPGSLSTPLFGQNYEEESFLVNMFTYVDIIPTFKDDIVKSKVENLVVKVEIDTKETQGEEEYFQKYDGLFIDDGQKYLHTGYVNYTWLLPLENASYCMFEFHRDLDPVTLSFWKTRSGSNKKQKAKCMSNKRKKSYEDVPEHLQTGCSVPLLVN